MSKAIIRVGSFFGDDGEGPSMPVKPYDFDLYRILLGDESPYFLLEVVFRTVVIFGYTLILLRCMGKRGLGNLTPFEFAIIVALGSAVGDPMFYDDVPLVHTMLVITIIVGMQRGLAWATEKSPVVEEFLESSPRLLVENGVIFVENLHDEQLAREELLEGLREQGIRHLGEVEAAYLEPSGNISVLRAKKATAGLSIKPSARNRPATPSGSKTGITCCGYCGALDETSALSSGSCPNCGHDQWATAVSVGSTD